MKKIIIVLLALCLLVPFCSCRTSDNLGEYPVTIGNVTFSEVPSKTVVLSDSIADIILACGYSTKLVARSDECSQSELSVLPSVGPCNGPDTNAIISQNPNLVIANSELNDETKKSITDAGITVLSMTPATTRDELKRLYSNVSAIFGGNKTGRERGEQRADNLFYSIDELNRRIPSSNIISTACYIYDVDGETCSVVTGDTFGSKLIEYSGSTNIASGSEKGNLDTKTLRMQNPKFIFCAPGVKEKLTAHESLKELNALSENKIFELDSNAMKRQGNTILTTVEFMVKSMYPEFAGISTDTVSSDSDLSSNSNSSTSSTSGEPSNSTASTSSVNGVKYSVNSSDGLNLRSLPESGDNAIASLANKEIVTLIEDMGNGWFKVQTSDGTEGYCSSQFLVKAP